MTMARTCPVVEIGLDAAPAPLDRVIIDHRARRLPVPERDRCVAGLPDRHRVGL